MIFFDTETTGFVKHAGMLEEQPRIIEIAMVKVNQELQVVDRLQTLVNPEIPLPPEISKITGLQDNDLTGAPLFIAVVNRLVTFCRGEDTIAAHNVEFDKMMLVHELQRIDWQWRFPYPTVWLDTMVGSNGRSLDHWSKQVMGDAYKEQTHRAMDDVERLITCWRHYVAESATE